MNYTDFTPEQKVLFEYITSKMDNSGCSLGDVMEVLAEVCGMLVTLAPSQGIGMKWLEDRFFQDIRNKAREWFDHRRVKEQYGNI